PSLHLFPYTTLFRSSSSRNRLLSYLRVGSGITLISAAAALALVAVKPSTPSLAVSQQLQWTEDGKISAAFSKHREDLFAAKVGRSEEHTSELQSPYD